MNSTTPHVEARVSHDQHSTQTVSPTPPPPRPPPPPPPLPLRRKNYGKLWGPYHHPTTRLPQRQQHLRPPPERSQVVHLPKAPALAPLQNRIGAGRPSKYFLEERQREEYVNICVPLYNAALKGDWHVAERIIKACPEVIKMSITKRQETVLHIVSSTKHTEFAENLVNMMAVEDLGLQNKDEETALCVAVTSTIKMVDVLLKRNNGLIKIRKKGDLPFLCAVFSGEKHMVEHMYKKTNLEGERWNYSDKQRMLDSCLAFGHLDIALDIFNKSKKKGILTIDTRALRSLAYNPTAFEGKVRPVFRRIVNTLHLGSRTRPLESSKAARIVRIMWREIVKQENVLKALSGKSGTEKVEGLHFTAARLGNYKFLIELLKLCPDLTWDIDDKKHTIFHIAVTHRQENVYNLLYELGSKKLGTTDNYGNNILHLAAIKPAQDRLNIVSGAALQMQREILWFKEVQSRVNLVDRRKVNKQGKSPQELFTDEHTKLMEKGETWMRQTAAQCMVVAALIATIMFAAAFTLPGGNNDDNGHPILMKKSAFKVFVVTDAISLCTSCASLLMFLAILTARYAENDFLRSLPVKLIVGLVTLFISIANMMIAFGASFFLLYARSMKWVPVLVTVLAGLPVILFVGLQYRLLIDVISSTFNSRHLFRPKKRMLY
ncbi:hypothetical protein DCAR_0313415 [Daucus carota subsp. sativus]|uniref:Uncharacterized protein n=1 Tax=Daucus carota subsp. sativus TaxID=79200 RepID=A0A166C0H4_DAUCS|nr:PREDICTED: ankyrin repeat-containing protein At3g12360-like [Daucus carota subsp. sativus]WOG94122.1 hypothetical protein DCAR_0313415 [Daucus carota subsp. sativus]